MSLSSQLHNEEILIRHKDGRMTGPLKAVFGRGAFTITASSPALSTGDIIDRPMPNGKSEHYGVFYVETGRRSRRAFAG
jgi:hypothetical protein